MPCHAYLYEDSVLGTNLVALQAATVELIAATSKHTNLDVQSNRQVDLNLWGAELSFPLQPVAYYVLVYDHDRRYSPVFTGNLNAGVAGRVDLVLSPLPHPYVLPAVGVRPQQFKDIGPFIDSQEWTLGEKRGAKLLVEAISAASSGEIEVPDAILVGWFEIATFLQIDPGLVSNHPRANWWGLVEFFRGGVLDLTRRRVDQVIYGSTGAAAATGLGAGYLGSTTYPAEAQREEGEE